jgi:catechol 2,3-dioxygenase-like lactoylglutathione lyase family enzyme
MLRIDHVVFPVWDAEATLSFYNDLLGLPLVQTFTGDDWGGRAWMMMIFALAEDRELALVAMGGPRPAPDGLPSDVHHYAFSVESQQVQDDWRRRLQAAKIDFWEEDHGPRHSLYFADPSGVILEITTPPSTPNEAPDPDALAVARRWISRADALTA